MPDSVLLKGCMLTRMSDGPIIIYFTTGHSRKKMISQNSLQTLTDLLTNILMVFVGGKGRNGMLFVQCTLICLEFLMVNKLESMGL